MILEVKNLGFHYQDRKMLFKNATFSIDKGEIFSILGANGIGKSTLMNCITNLLEPQEGEIFLHGKPLKELPLKTIAQGIGYVPPDPCSRIRL